MVIFRLHSNFIIIIIIFFICKYEGKREREREYWMVVIFTLHCN